MNWSTLIPQVLGILAACGTVLKGASWLAGAWKEKAKALQEEARAEERKAQAADRLVREVSEMRTSMANCLARVGECESRLLVIESYNKAAHDLSGVVQR